MNNLFESQVNIKYCAFIIKIRAENEKFYSLVKFLWRVVVVVVDENVKASWERFLNPTCLKQNIITASVYLIAFEMLKSSIEEKIRNFFIEGFDENGVTAGLITKMKYCRLIVAASMHH